MSDEQAHAREAESEDERLDRELLEMLGEVRVAMPGVQVLFGFLLAVPFQQRFETTTPFQRTVFLATLLSAALASAFLIAPVAYHRIMFREGDKPAVIAVGHATLLTGLGFLALSMTGAVLLATDLLYQTATVVIVAASIGSVFLLLWFVLASVRRASGRRSRTVSDSA